jgi:hypothetical protein
MSFTSAGEVMMNDEERENPQDVNHAGLVRSCKDCGINPWEYFDDGLRRIMSQPVTRLRELLPDQWKPLPKDERGLILAAKA